MLKVVAVHLEKLGLKYATVDGSVNPKQRMDMVEEFNSNPKGPQVWKRPERFFSSVQLLLDAVGSCCYHCARSVIAR